jgi:dihydrofolate reductase
MSTTPGNYNMEMIVAVAKNRIIGNTLTNTMLWNIPEDLNMFSKLTRDHVVVMGRNTFQSLPNGKLKRRINVVLSNTLSKSQEEEDDLFFVNEQQLWNVLSNITSGNSKKIFVIGGESIYRLLYSWCTKVHYTLVDLEPTGNVLFPFLRETLQEDFTEIETGEWNYSQTSGIPFRYISYSNRKYNI